MNVQHRRTHKLTKKNNNDAEKQHELIKKRTQSNADNTNHRKLRPAARGETGWGKKEEGRKRKTPREEEKTSVNGLPEAAIDKQWFEYRNNGIA